MNPARTFGPDLVGNRWTGIWVYLIAPPLGAALAWAVHAVVVRDFVGADESAVAEVLHEPDRPHGPGSTS